MSDDDHEVTAKRGDQYQPQEMIAIHNLQSTVFEDDHPIAGKVCVQFIQCAVGDLTFMYPLDYGLSIGKEFIRVCGNGLIVAQGLPPVGQDGGSGAS